jgi:deazaflavin-dependent oxidoreductase (nitroreductase family)
VISPFSRVGAEFKEMHMSDVNDWNAQIIAEFRANGGAVGGQFEGAPMAILHTVGAKTGKVRENPMMYQAVDDSFAVFASKAGADTNPDWFHNLVANPDIDVEVGRETLPVRARVLEGDERDAVWTAQKERYPGFAEYEAKTSRRIPVVLLERRS